MAWNEKWKSADLDDLLAGGSLRVVLWPAKHDADAVEWFDLPSIVIDGDKYWGISAPAAAQDYLKLPGFDLSKACSYAYNNYADLVFNANPHTELTRIYNASSYDMIEFVAVPDYEEIWEFGKNDTVEPVREAVKQGRGLKVAFTDDDGLRNIFPVHMPIIDLNVENFRLDTYKSAYPALLRSTETILQLEARHLAHAKANSPEFASGEIPYANAQLNDVQYVSTFFQFMADGTYKYDPSPGNDPIRTYGTLRVFAEIFPE